MTIKEDTQKKMFAREDDAIVAEMNVRERTDEKVKVRDMNTKGGTNSQLFLLFLFILASDSVAGESDFFWENPDISKPVNYSGGPLQIPVIEGEQVEITCKRRAYSDTDNKRLKWATESFNATTSEPAVVEENGKEYFYGNITVNVDNPVEIDEKWIKCAWRSEDGHSKTISLRFKVYVPDYSSCDSCHSTKLKLRRPTNQRKEDQNLEVSFAKKVQQNPGVSEVNIDSNGIVCGCQDQEEDKEGLSPGAIGAVVAGAVFTAGLSTLGYFKGREFIKKKYQQIINPSIKSHLD